MKKNLLYLTLLVFVSLAACSKDKEPAPVAVESVSLNKSAITLDVGAKDTIVATVSPDNAADKTVTFTSGNTSVATVDNNGVVTAVAIGTAVITVAAGNGKSSTCNVTVESDPEITMTLPLKAQTVEIGLSGSGTVQIEWGDGTSATKTLREEGDYYTHDYTPSNINRTLKITGGTVIALSCGNMDLIALDVSKSLALEAIECFWNKLTTLDLSKNTALKSLSCYSNELTTLDLSKNIALEYLRCSNNLLSALDLSKNTAVIDINCNSNRLTALDISKNIALQSLECETNLLTELNTEQNTALLLLGCSINSLTSLNLSKNTALIMFDCSDNQLAALDVSKNTELDVLLCYGNSLTSLDLTNNTKIVDVYCDNNNMTAAALNALYGTLHNNTIENRVKKIYITDNPGADDSNISIATAKGWNFSIWG